MKKMESEGKIINIHSLIEILKEELNELTNYEKIETIALDLNIRTRYLEDGRFYIYKNITKED